VDADTFVVAITDISESSLGPAPNKISNEALDPVLDVRVLDGDDRCDCNATHVWVLIFSILHMDMSTITGKLASEALALTFAYASIHQTQ
jgi:hypothetical protein